MLIVNLSELFRKERRFPKRRVFSRRLRDCRALFRATEEEILDQRIARLLKLGRSSLKINSTLVQVCDSVGHVKRIFHIMGDHDAGHSKALLQPANQSIDAIRYHGIEARCGLIIQYTGGPANNGACETNSLLHSAAQTLRHLFLLALHFHHFEHFLHFRTQNLWIAFTRLTQWKSDVFLHGHRIEKRTALEKNADLFADLPELTFAHSDDVLALDPNFPRVGLHQSDKMFKQNTFSAAASSNNRECLTGYDLKIDATQNFLLSDLFGQCAHRDHWRRPTRSQRRLNRGLGRWLRFDHRNAQTSTLNSQLSIHYSKAPSRRHSAY